MGLIAHGNQRSLACDQSVTTTPGLLVPRLVSRDAAQERQFYANSIDVRAMKGAKR